MTVTPSLLDICTSTIARHLPFTVTVTCAAVPEPELVQRIYLEYTRLTTSRRLCGLHNPAAHLASIRQFAACWQPAVLSLQLQQFPGCSLAELSAFSGCLRHLELSCDASSSVTSLTSLTSLACLSLRGSLALQATELQQTLQGLTQLRALDLCDVPAVTDELVPVLASMLQLQVLNLNRTQCTDVTVDWLTYGHRLQQWQQAAQRQQQQQQQKVAGPTSAAPPGNQGQAAGSPVEQWSRCKVRQWHLANTRITPRAAEFLRSLSELTFLDMRGSGVTASQLLPLRTKFSLRTPQGAVLSCSAAMAVAAVSLDAFVCSQPAEHYTVAGGRAGAGGGGRGLSCSHRGCDAGVIRHWVQEGVTELICARAQTEQQAAAQAPEQPAVTAQQYLVLFGNDP